VNDSIAIGIIGCYLLAQFSGAAGGVASRWGRTSSTSRGLDTFNFPCLNYCTSLCISAICSAGLKSKSHSWNSSYRGRGARQSIILALSVPFTSFRLAKFD